MLAVYGTAFGQTERIVQHIAEVLTDHGATVTLMRADRLPRRIDFAGYDACLVAASVILGRHQRTVRRFVRRYAASLNAVPSAFVSVCGAAIGSSTEERTQARGYVDQFSTATGWAPRLTAIFAGATPFTRYGFITRWLMQRISRSHGRPADGSRDYDFTDWSAVDRFAHELMAHVGHAPAHTRP
jgi:menaquinone-dependent protoporphyrinogen oxidase